MNKEQIREGLVSMMEGFDLPTGGIDQIIQKNREKKSAINELFGLTEENGFRQTLLEIEDPDQLMEDHRLILELIISYADWALDSIVWPQISVKDGQLVLKYALSGDTEYRKVKLSKWLTEQNDDFIEFVRHAEEIDRVLSDLNLVDHQGQPDKSKLKGLVPTIFQMIKSVGELIISTNPIDFIGINYNASYGSCYDIKSFGGMGCHFGATTSHATDDFCVALYVKSKKAKHKGKKLGRSWAFVFPEQNMILQTRSYGSFNNSHRRQAREWMAEKLFSVPKENLIFGSAEWRHYDRNESPCYFDVGIDFVSLGEKADSFLLKFGPGVCINCGEPTFSSNKGLCHDCYQRLRGCCCCGATNLNDESGIETGGGSYYCGRCAEESLFFCNECDSYQHVDYRININGDFVCESCAERNFVLCDGCGEYVRYDDTESYGFDVYCQRCAEQELRTCPDCHGRIRETSTTCHFCEQKFEIKEGVA